MPVSRRAALAGGALSSAALVAASLPRLAHAAGGGTLLVLQSEAPRSMDPGDHTASFTGAVLDPMYEGLLRRNEKLELEPALATGWQAENNGRTWVFTLREGVTFHDGTPFDADAAAKSLSRFLDPRRGLAAAGRARAAIAGARARDPRTLEVTLIQPYPGILPLLATNQLSIVSPKAEAAGTLSRTAAGTGPFRMAEWRSGEFVQQSRFDGYWGPKPTLDAIRWTWSTEQSVLSMALQTGDADVVNPLPPVFAAATARDPRLKLVATDGAFVFWCALNTKLKPLDDARVRQALNFATDRPALVQALLLGNGRPANSPLAPVTPGFDPALDLYPYDLQKAKALLTDAGVGSGLTVKVIVQEQEANIAEALSGMWAKAGVTLDVQRMESGLWLKTAQMTPEQKAENRVGGVIASWSAGAFNPDLQLRPLYATASAAPAGVNFGFFSDPALDALLDKASATLDDRERDAAYRDAQRLIQQNAPAVLLYYKKDLVAVNADVSGVWVIPGGTVEVKNATKRS